MPASEPGPGKLTSLQTGRAETFFDTSGPEWAFERDDGPGTRWAILHKPTGRWTPAAYGTERKARAAAADGTALAALDAAHQARCAACGGQLTRQPAGGWTLTAPAATGALCPAAPGGAGPHRPA